MSASVQTPAGLKTVSAVSIQTAAGLKTASAGYVGTAAGPKQFFSSGGGGGGGTTPPPVTPPFNVAISQSGSGLGSITAGQNASETLSAVVSQGSAALAPPFTYAWTASSSNTYVARVSLSSTAVQSPTLSESGVSAGTATITAQVVVTDANGVQETASLSYTVTVTAAQPPQQKFTLNFAGPGEVQVNVGQTVDETYSVSVSGSPTSPLSYAWFLSGSGSVNPSIVSGQGTSSIVVSFTGASTGDNYISVNCRVTDAANVGEQGGISLYATTPQ